MVYLTPNRLALRSLFLLSLVLARCAGAPDYVLLESENPRLHANTAFQGFEYITSPGFVGLREKYRPDTVFKGDENEFNRQLLLRHWIRTVIHISDFEPAYPGEGVPEKILDAALGGQGFHCGHYMIVQNAVMNAYGFVTRCIGAGPGVKGGPDGHHGVNEVWSNTFRKWYLSDAKYDHHFEKGGIPLSALEIRDEFLKNAAADIELVKGPDRIPIVSDHVADKKGEMIETTKARFAQVYTWIEYESHNDRYTHWPESGDRVAILNMYADEYFMNNKWIWDGKPHWAYGTEFMKLVNDRDAIEWTPNTISSSVTIEGDVAYIDLQSETPNFRCYEIRRHRDAVWREIPASAEIKLSEEEEELWFRTVNVAGVTGPVHMVKIAKR